MFLASVSIPGGATLERCRWRLFSLLFRFFFSLSVPFRSVFLLPVASVLFPYAPLELETSVNDGNRFGLCRGFTHGEGHSGVRGETIIESPESWSPKLFLPSATASGFSFSWYGGI